MLDSPAKRQRLDLSNTITISAGQGTKVKEFIIHTSYATKSSPYIKAALSRDWKEAREKRINIPDVEPVVFEGYLHWIYSREVTLAETKQLCTGCEKRKDGKSQCASKQSLEMAKIYVLDDYLNDICFCNAVIDTWKAIKYSTACCPNTETIRYIWKHTASDCSLRDLIYESWKPVLTTDEIGDYFKTATLPKDFTTDFLVFLAKAYKKQIDQDTSAQKSPFKKKCTFHKHVDDADKCS